MAISSLQSLIAQYGANFGIDAKTIAAAKASLNPVKTEETPKPDGKDGSANADTVHLSQEALDYQKAHTSPTGKFQPPNLFGDMLDAFDKAEDSAGAETPTMADLLSGGQTDAGDPSGAGDPGSYFNSLGRFLE
ncbi:MAG: hypothetical protein ABI036_17950 [Fibrobacteria bacterium]